MDPTLRRPEIMESETDQYPTLERKDIIQWICSIGSYLCVLKLKGDRIPSLVDEPGLCDLSVIIGLAYYSLLLVALQCCSKQILGDFRRQEPNMSFEFAMLPFLSPD
ncbi:hypothetical protein GOBAR_DD25158 [Gossypium barbadense]|nr:hypothetical protein GOBAR_DD25158 [Gossypium barbadense]